MMKCIKCQKEVKVVAGERAALWMLLALPLLAYFAGWSLLLLAPFSFYIYKTRHSSRYVCDECKKQLCPTCGTTEKGDEYCKNCKILICPFCGNAQPYSTSVSWPAAILLLLLLPGVLIVGLLSTWLLIDIYLIYLLISAPRCTGCGESIYIARYGM